MLGEPLTNVIDTNVENADAELDYATLFDVVRVAIAAGAVEVVRDIVVNGHDVMVVVDALEVEQYEEVIYAATNALPQLKLVEGLLDDIIEAYLSQYKLSDEELDSVDFVAEINTINTIIASVIDLAVANEIKTVADYMKLPTNYLTYVSDANAYEVIEIVKAVLALEVIDLIAFDAYNNKVHNNLVGDEAIIELLDIAGTYGTTEHLVEELVEVVP